MANRLESALETVSSAVTLDDLNNSVVHLRDVFDVEHLVYHSVNPAGGQYAALTYAPDWVERYVAEDYERIDPVVQGCFRRFRPVDWKQLDWTGKPVRNFLAEAIDAGVGNQGFSVPIRGPVGQFALFTVNDRADDRRWQQFTNARLPELILLAHFINEKALEIEGATEEARQASLSPREVDALTLLALGRSRAQAADKLTISEHTLRAYIESARFKLGAANTTHAVACALTRGLVVL